MRPFGWSHYFLIFTDWFVKSHIHFPGFSQHFFLVMFALTPVGPTICALVALPGLAFPGYLWPSGRPMLMMATWHNMGMALVVVCTFFWRLLHSVWHLYSHYVSFCHQPPFKPIGIIYWGIKHHNMKLLALKCTGIYCTTHFTKIAHFCCALHFHLNWTAVAVEFVEESPNANLNRFRPERKKTALLQIRRKTGK